VPPGLLELTRILTFKINFMKFIDQFFLDGIKPSKEDFKTLFPGISVKKDGDIITLGDDGGIYSIQLNFLEDEIAICLRAHCTLLLSGSGAGTIEQRKDRIRSTKDFLKSKDEIPIYLKSGIDKCPNLFRLFQPVFM